MSRVHHRTIEAATSAAFFMSANDADKAPACDHPSTGGQAGSGDEQSPNVAGDASLSPYLSAARNAARNAYGSVLATVENMIVYTENATKGYTYTLIQLPTTTYYTTNRYH